MTNNRSPNRGGTRTPPPAEEDYEPAPRRRGGYQRQGVVEAATKSFIRSIASSIGRIIVRSITGRMR